MVSTPAPDPQSLPQTLPKKPPFSSYCGLRLSNYSYSTDKSIYLANESINASNLRHMVHPLKCRFDLGVHVCISVCVCVGGGVLRARVLEKDNVAVGSNLTYEVLTLAGGRGDCYRHRPWV